MKPLHELLSDLGACDGDRTPDNAVAWSRPYGTDYERAWRECERGDWLLWLAAKLELDRKLIVRAGCACAREALVHVPGGEDRPRLAIETAERWCDGDASIDEVRAAGDAAWGAGDAAWGAGDAAWDAWAAAYAAWAAWAAEAACAAARAAEAAEAAETAGAAARARAASLRRSAELVRETANSSSAPPTAASRLAHTHARARAASLRRSAELVREIIDWEIVQQAAARLQETAP